MLFIKQQRSLATIIGLVVFAVLLAVSPALAQLTVLDTDITSDDGISANEGNTLITFELVGMVDIGSPTGR